MYMLDHMLFEAELVQCGVQADPRLNAAYTKL